MFEGVLIVGLGARLTRGDDTEYFLIDLFVGHTETAQCFSDLALFVPFAPLELSFAGVGDGALQAGEGKGEGLEGGEILMEGEGALWVRLDPAGGAGNEDLEEFEI